LRKRENTHKLEAKKEDKAMRKFQTFLFLLLALMYLGAHTSCSHVEADLRDSSAFMEMQD